MITDVPAMMDLERQSPAAAHWSRGQHEALFVTAEGQPQSERFALVVEGEGESPEILAFLVAHRVDLEWVAAAARRRGVGTHLLGEFVAHAREEQGSGIFLEVRESNRSARALYRKAGFEEVGLRKSYYSNPVEDAILCRVWFD
jgi:ribosomal-protein-alanine N-acetyltransferase